MVVNDGEGEGEREGMGEGETEGNIINDGNGVGTGGVAIGYINVGNVCLGVSICFVTIISFLGSFFSLYFKI